MCALNYYNKTNAKGYIHALYIMVLSGVKVSYLIFSTDYVLSNTYNETAFPELRKLFEEAFDI